MPAEEKPAEEKPASADDLFGDPDAPAAKPAEEKPAEPAPADDLFGEPEAPAAEKPADAPAADDLFGEPETPAAQPAPAAAPADSADDLFGTPEAEAPAAPPAETPKADSGSDADDLFKDSSYRNWKDNTGNYAVHAKLIVIYDDSVRLLKENGKTTSVSFRRLSESDRQYVAEVLAKLSRNANTQLVEFNAR